MYGKRFAPHVHMFFLTFAQSTATSFMLMFVEAVDYHAPEAKKDFVASILRKGFAVLKNHPISPTLIESAYQEWKLYFNSPEKMNDVFDPKVQAGYFPFQSENAKDQAEKDLKEFYHYYDWHTLPTQAQEHTPRLRLELIELASKLLGWIEQETPQNIREHFSIPLHEFIKGSTQTLLRAIHYPPLSGDEQEGAVRAAAHEDINLITLLPASSAPGLEVQDLDGHWHEVSCDPGMIVINSGDMLKEASDGYYPSTSHRVINPSGELAKISRYSLPLFLHARADVRISSRHTQQSYLRERLIELGLIEDSKA